ncbi:MAG: hypothetical protein DELT_00302 [Desulfovibrio sp.]
MARSIKKESKVRNYVEKKGENYEKQLHQLGLIAPLYYQYIFDLHCWEINPYNVLYFPTYKDIMNIYNKIIDYRGNKKLSFMSTRMINMIRNYSFPVKDDYCIDTSIGSIKSALFNRYEYFLSKHNKSIKFTMSYNERIKSIHDRLFLLEYTVENMHRDEFDIEKYFDGNSTDKPYEQIHELSCIIQNLYNGLFPGFYTHEEIKALLVLVTGNKNFKYRDIQTIWDRIPSAIKRILPNPYLNIPELLSKYHNSPPHPFLQEETS